MAHCERADQKAERDCGNTDHIANGRLVPLCQAADDRQDDQAQDVVDHRRPQHDLAFRLVQPAEIVEHAGRNADARGRQRGAGHDTLKIVLIEQMADKVSSRKGEHDPNNRHRGRRRAGPQQLHQVRFQPDLKQENHHPDFLQEMEDGRLRRW